MQPTSLQFPDIDELAAELAAGNDALDAEIVDLSDTITQWQAAKLKLAELIKASKGD